MSREALVDNPPRLPDWEVKLPVVSRGEAVLPLFTAVTRLATDHGPVTVGIEHG